MNFVERERAALATLFLAQGPNAPTLCEGWVSRDLAAHLWVRENRPDAAIGMGLTFLAGFLESQIKKAKERPFEELVRDWAAGPSRLNPLRYLDKQMNLTEHFVHHEDLRRGQWMVDGTLAPARELSTEDNEALAGALKCMAPMMLRGKDHPSRLIMPGREPIEVFPRGTHGKPTVTVTGEPGEVLMWAFGRDAHHATVIDPNAQ